MARKKTVVERKPIKVKKTRKISEEQKEKLRARLAEMRAKKNLLNIRTLIKWFLLFQMMILILLKM